jgi:hypothetical protein
MIETPKTSKSPKTRKIPKARKTPKSDPASVETQLAVQRMYIAAFQYLEREHTRTIDRLANDISELKQARVYDARAAPNVRNMGGAVRSRYTLSPASRTRIEYQRGPEPRVATSEV